LRTSGWYCIICLENLWLVLYYLSWEPLVGIVLSVLRASGWYCMICPSFSFWYCIICPSFSFWYIYI
jgi:hypothetical protein